MATTIRSYASAHPARYAAANGTRVTGPDDPLLIAGIRVVDSIAAALRGYGIADSEMVHAIRTIRSTIHGFALLQQTEGFQYREDPDDTFDWLIRFVDQGLRVRIPLALRVGRRDPPYRPRRRSRRTPAPPPTGPWPPWMARDDPNSRRCRRCRTPGSGHPSWPAGRTVTRPVPRTHHRPR